MGSMLKNSQNYNGTSGNSKSVRQYVRVQYIGVSLYVVKIIKNGTVGEV